MVCNDDPCAIALMQNAGVQFFLAPTDRPDVTGWEKNVLEGFRPALWLNDRLGTGAEHAKEILGKARLVTLDDPGEGGLLAETRILSMPCMFSGMPGRQDYVGVEYLLLDPAVGSGKTVRNDSDELEILVSMGGSDTWGASIYVAKQLLSMAQPATILTGPAFAHNRELEEIMRADSRNILHRKEAVPSLAEIFPDYTLLLCSGGMTPFEAAANGLPAAVLATEEHERANAMYIHKQGFGIMLGERYKGGFTGNVGEAIAICRKRGLKRMSETAAQTIDGHGLERVTAILVGMLHGQ
jgi:hypothetical protein